MHIDRSKLERFLIGRKNNAGTYSHRQRSLLLGIFCVASIFVAIYYVFADLALGTTKFMPGFAIIISVSLISSFLNYNGRYKFAVVLQLLMTNLIVFYFCLAGSVLYQNHLFFIIICIAALAMFEFEERQWAYFFVAFSCVLFIISYFDPFSIVEQPYNSAGAINFVIVLLVVVMIAVFIMKLYHHAERKEAVFNRRVSELQMEALRAQINPHFLFNALNSINRFVITKDTLNANLYLTKLSKLIRTILENSRSKTVSLAEEVSILTMYVEIEKIRLEDRFDLTVEVDPLLDQHLTKLPSMIIQPYVENAIWHGIAPKAGKGQLDIDFRKIESFLRITVRDNGVGRAKKNNSQSGISRRESLGGKITEERINLINRLNNQSSSIQIIDLTDDNGHALGTEVRINLSLK